MVLNRALSFRTLKRTLLLRTLKRATLFLKLVLLDVLQKTIFAVEFLRTVLTTLPLQNVRISMYFFNPVHATGLFLCILKKLEVFCSGVFRGYREETSDMEWFQEVII